MGKKIYATMLCMACATQLNYKPHRMVTDGKCDYCGCDRKIFAVTITKKSKSLCRKENK